MKNFGIFFLLFALAFTACRKNIDEVSEVPTTPDPAFLDNYMPTYIQANGDLTGFIVDENEEPVQNAQVKLGTSTTTTDQFGHFFFTGIDMNAAGTIVQVAKDGYFAGSRRFNAVANVENRMKIELLTKTFSQAFESQSGGTIELNGGGTVVFAPNTIQKANGTVYNGAVKVASKWMDPSKIETLDQMPGNLFGVNNRGEEVVLGTYGMIAVELESADGEPLNILKGETATVTTPVPADMQANAPAEIPLWSYNEEFGIWVEEGVSVLQNGNYVAEVTHFSFWNHDFPAELVSFTAVITDEDGNPLENYKVTITDPSTSTYGYGYTCEDGTVAGYIPINTTLNIEILGLCGEVIYTQEIGPFAADTDLGTIAIPTSQLEATTITGELVDCDGNSLTAGVVIITSSNGTVYEYVTGEAFEVIISACTLDNIEVTGYNLNEMLQSEVVSATPTAVNNLGDIAVCDVIEDFISLTVDGVTETYFINITVDSDITFTYISLSIGNQEGFVGFGFSGSTIGNYDNPENFIEVLFDSNNNWEFNNNINGFETFNITEYGAPGEKIVGDMSGTFENFGVNPSVTVDITGSFSVTNPN
jgi:hypothetical protein